MPDVRHGDFFSVESGKLRVQFYHEFHFFVFDCMSRSHFTLNSPHFSLLAGIPGNDENTASIRCPFFQPAGLSTTVDSIGI